MLDLEFAELTDAGKAREHNEDCFGHAAPSDNTPTANQGWLFVLADGVGGHERGEVASRLAVDTLLSGFREILPNETSSACLQRLVQSANLSIYQAAAGVGPAASNMCTTIVACLIRNNRVTVAHVGDSRCYLVRGDQVRRLTHDHTVVGEQVRMGLLSEQEAAASDRRNLLSRSLGSNAFASVELNEHQLVVGDILLLSSDGLHGSLAHADIAEILSQTPVLQDAARKLVGLALDRDGSDNITIQLIRINSVERMGMYRGRPYKLR